MCRNATRLFYGTVWTSTTLLSQMTRLAWQAEQVGGIRRVFFYTADDVRKENPNSPFTIRSDIRIAEDQSLCLSYRTASVDLRSIIETGKTISCTPSDTCPSRHSNNRRVARCPIS